MNKRFSGYFLLTVILIGVIYSYKDPLGNAKTYFEGKFFPCSRPVSYSLGTVDPKFGISKADLLKDLESSAKVWDDFMHKTLFEYKPTGGMVTVNLIYDYR